jgi:hypothetical protein
MPVYDDFYSFLHTIAGGIATYYGGTIGLFIVGAFTAYQAFEKEPMGNKAGDFVEFGIGLTSGYLIKQVT